MMLIKPGFSSPLAWVAAVSLILAARSAAAEPNDAKARALADKAMKADYLSAKFKLAEQKLKKAIQLCGRGNCSKRVLAGIHRDLGIVYMVGLRQAAKGKAELRLALDADPDIELERDLAPEDLKAAFAEAGGQGASKPKDKGSDSATRSEASAKPVPAPKSEASKSEPSAAGDLSDKPTGSEDKPADTGEKAASVKPECDPTDAACQSAAAAAPAPEESSAKSGVQKNWISLSVQQEFLTFPPGQGVCNRDSQYTCFLQGSLYTGGIYQGAGNEVRAGVGVATTRVLAGFDRLFGENITLGVRLGFAFRGSPAANGDSFQPLHAELRANYWFGSNPFGRSGIRPYAGLALGLAEVDGKVSVDFFDSQQGFQQNAKGTLDAWRKTGRSFVSAGFGSMFPVGDRFGIVPELRVMQMLGVSGTVIAINAGLAMGL